MLAFNIFLHTHRKASIPGNTEGPEKHAVVGAESDEPFIDYGVLFPHDAGIVTHFAFKNILKIFKNKNRVSVGTAKLAVCHKIRTLPAPAPRSLRQGAGTNCGTCPACESAGLESCD
jgi:hypothetical protein